MCCVIGILVVFFFSLVVLFCFFLRATLTLSLFEMLNVSPSVADPGQLRHAAGAAVRERGGERRESHPEGSALQPGPPAPVRTDRQTGGRQQNTKTKTSFRKLAHHFYGCVQIRSVRAWK